jgi:hypothetical protein
MDKETGVIQVGSLQLIGPLLINTSDVGAKLYAMAGCGGVTVFL